MSSSSNRVAIVAGLRTPFAKAGTDFAGLTALDLGKSVVQELVQRSGVDPQKIDQLVFGQVIPTLTAPSIAREVVLAAGLPRKIEAHTAVRACATSVQTLINAANSIRLGQSEIAVVGGTESMSDIPVFASRPLAQALLASSRARSLVDRLRPFSRLKPKDLRPNPPAIAEYSTGLTMGQSAEKMAKENGISRREQDELALASHLNAAKAWEEGFFAEQVMKLPLPNGRVAARDNLVRADTSEGALAKLKPVFDREHGSVTAGNSSPLTDGASALLVMSEAKAKELGHQPLGYLRAHAFAATDPAGQLLQGPAYAAPLALDRAGMTLQDIDLFEMHEAFGAQLASNLQAFASPQFAAAMGRSAPLGEVDRQRLNVAGGSIALGHPFGATGARVILQALYALRRANRNTALCTVCAAGGLGAAVVLERS